MNEDEKALLAQIEKQPGFTVQYGKGVVVIGQQIGSGSRQSSVWLGRSRTKAALQSYLTQTR